MAVFSRFCTLAFSLSTVSKNCVMKQSIETRQSACNTFPVPLTSESSGILDDVETTSSPAPDLSQLCQLFGATPHNLLRLDLSPSGIRGVYLNQDIAENDMILSLPLDSCLADDSPPDWFVGHDDDDSAWATRLAATLMDSQTFESEGMAMWFKLLPDPSYLRASLPIHWPEDVVSSARCTALELAVDSAYFARADAVGDLLQHAPEPIGKEECDNALDLVQTRSCRIEKDGVPLRLLAPVFDFINHGSAKSLGTVGSANAAFGLEGDQLVVRTLMDLQANDEVLIDYGESARPPWKCLASYGYVPEYLAEEDEDDNLAEVYMHGQRFEVGPSTIPVDLVLETQSSAGLYEGEEPEAVLSPEIALRIASRVSEVAFQLLLDQEDLGSEELLDNDIDDDTEEDNKTPEELISARLAASLRWSQHRTLLACGKGLRDWAAQQATKEE